MALGGLSTVYLLGILLVAFYVYLLFYNTSLALEIFKRLFYVVFVVLRGIALGIYNVIKWIVDRFTR